jgi:hypothetical protein
MKEKKGFVHYLYLVFWAAICSIVYYFGFGKVPDEPQKWLNMDKGVPGVGVYEYSTLFYWKTHPIMWEDITGFIAFCIGTFIFLGAWGVFLGERYVTKGQATSLYLGAAALAAVGIGVIFIR